MGLWDLRSPALGLQDFGARGLMLRAYRGSSNGLKLEPGRMS